MRTLHRNNGRGLFISNKYLVLDTETNGLNPQPEYFKFCCLWDGKKPLYFYNVDDIKNELLKIKYKNKIIFVHNAEYDLNCIYGNIIRNLDNSAVYSGSGFISATNGICIFADSLNIYKTSVKNIGNMVGLPKLDIDKKFVSGNVRNITEQDKLYCLRDCEIIYNALFEIFTFAGSVKKTLASLALALFKNKYLKYDLDYQPEYTDLFRLSYFGGRNEVFTFGKCRAHYYDINSMYPYAMLKPFPNPKKFKKENNVKIDRFIHLLENCEGLADVELFHVKHYFGFLPVKINNKLMFPCGNLHGTWNFNELRYAYNNGIIKFKKINWTAYSDITLDSPFIEYVTDLYDIKNNAEGIKKTNAKLFLNSLYGKFGEKQHNESTYYEYIPFDLLSYYNNLDIEYEIKLFNNIRTDCYISVKTESKNNSHQIPMFASYITSYSRIYLLEYLLKWFKYKPLYCDTDSIFLEIEPKNHVFNNKIGEFKKETDIITEIRGLKNYSYIDKNHKNYDKIKGIPLKSAKKINKNTYKYNTLIKSKSAIRRKIKTGKKMTVKKILKNSYDKRIIFNFTETKPVFIK